MYMHDKSPPALILIAIYPHTFHRVSKTYNYPHSQDICQSLVWKVFKASVIDTVQVRQHWFEYSVIPLSMPFSCEPVWKVILCNSGAGFESDCFRFNLPCQTTVWYPTEHDMYWG